MSKKRPKKTKEVVQVSNSNGKIWVIVALVLILSWTYEFYPELKSVFRVNFFGQDNDSLNEEWREERIDYWESVIEKQPSYQRAYLELAILYAESNDLTSAKIHLNSALSIDPNNSENRDVERYIESREIFSKE